MGNTIYQKHMTFITKDSTKSLPHHIVIIPDGNGRWAKAQGKFVTAGHKKGFEVVQKIITFLGTMPEIHIVTIWGFSSDNWKRSQKEVTGLMLLFERVIRRTLHELQERDGRFVHVGRKDRIPQQLRKTIEDAEKLTSKNSGQIVCLAIDFGGQDQDIRVLQKAQKLHVKNIDSSTLWSLRDGAGIIPSADLLIRTSGEKRISDIGWLNGAQTELVFLSKLFPDIQESDIQEALDDFSKRERRLGGRGK